jgi:hypothetical protein
MIDIANESILPLKAGSKLCSVSFCTIWRWVLKGARTPDGQVVRLRAVRLGSRWITSTQAIEEFTRALTPRLDGTLVVPTRTTSQQQRASERASKVLAAAGI